MKSKTTLNYAAFFAMFSLGVMLIFYSSEVSAAVIASIKSCVYRIIPSLFAMTVVSTAISRSGTVGRIMRKTHIDADIFTAFVFGNIGGYPIGAKLLAEAVDMKRLTPLQASEAMTFCYASGPAFAAGVVGTAIFGDIRFGLCAFLSNFLANLTLYIAFLLKNRSYVNEKDGSCIGFSTKLMTDSVNSAAVAMSGICSMILFFSALKAVLEAVVPALKESPYFASVLEISNIAELKGCKGVSLVTAALLLAFGGICVNMQIISIVSGKFSVKHFYFTRLIQLPLCALYAYSLEKILALSGISTEAATKIRLSQSPSLIPIICVFAMVFITLCERAKTVNRQSF